MRTSRFVVILLGLIATSFALSAAETSGGDKPALDSHLEPLRPWVGKTWRGTFKNSTPEKPTIDIARWERALNGRAVRILHSINQGAYGGETLVVWDEQKQALVYHYFTTAGFTTTGTMSFKEGKVFTHEVVNGAASGVTEVRATIEMSPDGTFHIKTEHLKNGAWALGRETTYREDPSAQVIFK